MWFGLRGGEIKLLCVNMIFFFKMINYTIENLTNIAITENEYIY